MAEEHVELFLKCWVSFSW